jgi:spore germination protein YaaH
MAVWVAFVVFALTLFYLWERYVPNFNTVPLPYTPGNSYHLVTGDVIEKGGAIVTEDGGVLLPFDVVHQFFDPNIFWDEPTQSVIVTTQDKVVRMETESLTAYVNSRPVQLKMPVGFFDNKPHVPMDPLIAIYDMRLSVHSEPKMVILDTRDSLEGVREATVKQGKWPWEKGTVLRDAPSIKGRIVARLPANDSVFIFPDVTTTFSEKPGEYGPASGWVKARSGLGYIGYVRVRDIIIGQALSLSDLFPLTDNGLAEADQGPGRNKAERSFNSQNPISLAWDYVGKYTPRYDQSAGHGSLHSSKNQDEQEKTPGKSWPEGINVVSPTWFSLGSGGQVNNLADALYVKDAHRSGLEVWALVSNSFDPDLTHEVLHSAHTREQTITQLLVLAELYGFDGYNIDFENVYPEDAPLLVQFVREFVPLAREQRMTISVDITVKSKSPNWSMCYDRKGLAQAADYLVLMAYDQFPASSPEPGPVSALPWTERSIKKTLEEVPASKLILGMPLYVRLWTENGDTNAQSRSLSSRALSIRGIHEMLTSLGVEPEWDVETGLPIATFMNSKGRNTVWIENDDTIKARIEMAKRHSLAGVAAWRMGYEGNGTWETVSREVAAKPLKKAGEQASSVLSTTPVSFKESSEKAQDLS